MSDTAPSVTPICAFDVTAGGCRPVAEAWPRAAAGPEANYRWLHLDLNLPETALWAREKLPEIAAQALLQSETRPRCDRLDQGLVLNLRGVNLNPGASPEDMVSLRLWVTEDCIVSARLRKVWAADELRRAAEAGRAPASVGLFLHELVQGLTRRIEAVSLELDEETDGFEDIDPATQALPGPELNQLRQTVTKMRRFVNPQREALGDLTRSQMGFLDTASQRLLRESANRTQRALEELDATRDRLALIMEHHQAQGANLMSRNSYLLSVVAAIFLPLGFLTGLFGVNVAGMPGIETPWAFGALALASAALGVALYLLFKLMRWL
ncbi:zinc transporter ZntB [Shimia sp.]|uniref:zinc transporter ZntB n=1 Tax=Shimia sp. TaxID=1954381 RepID=UPI00356216A6